MRNPLARFLKQRVQLRSWAASGLLFLFVSDLGYHLLAPLLASPNAQTETWLLPGQGHAGSSESDPGCGIPDHSGTPFHHHHFPAVVTQAVFPVPLITLAWVSGILLVGTVPPAFVTSLSRAPPQES